MILVCNAILSSPIDYRVAGTYVVRIILFDETSLFFVASNLPYGQHQNFEIHHLPDSKPTSWLHYEKKFLCGGNDNNGHPQGWFLLFVVVV